jgi:hypothetical protein
MVTRIWFVSTRTVFRVESSTSRVSGVDATTETVGIVVELDLVTKDTLVVTSQG